MDMVSKDEKNEVEDYEVVVDSVVEGKEQVEKVYIWLIRWWFRKRH